MTSFEQTYLTFQISNKILENNGCMCFLQTAAIRKHICILISSTTCLLALTLPNVHTVNQLNSTISYAWLLL